MSNKKRLNGKTKASLVKNFFSGFSDFFKKQKKSSRNSEEIASNHYEGIQSIEQRKRRKKVYKLCWEVKQEKNCLYRSREERIIILKCYCELKERENTQKKVEKKEWRAYEREKEREASKIELNNCL